MKTYRKHLKSELKDQKFKEIYNEEVDLLKIALKISEERTKLGLTQKQLAHKAHVTQQQLSKIENGINCNMSTFIKICNALKMKLDIETISA